MKNQKTIEYRKTAIIVGVLFITATVATSVSFILSDPLLNVSNYLTSVSMSPTQMKVASLSMLIDALAVAGIAITIYPVLKKHNETLALGYVGARIMEGLIFVIYVIMLLTLLTLGQEYIKEGASGASYLVMGTLLLAASEWTFLLGYGIVFTLSALILNYLLYRSKLVPRWISALGIIGAFLAFIFGLMGFSDLPSSEILNIPIAVQEMVLAVWLIAKGFNQDALAAEFDEIEND